MEFKDLDSKIQTFVMTLSERASILNISIVPNNDNREEYEIMGSSGMFVQKIYIWKNPDSTYGWSDQPHFNRNKVEKFMGDIKHVNS